MQFNGGYTYHNFKDEINFKQTNSFHFKSGDTMEMSVYKKELHIKFANRSDKLQSVLPLEKVDEKEKLIACVWLVMPGSAVSLC